MAFTFAYSVEGDTSAIKDFPVSAGYTPKRGDLVYLDASGNLAACAVGTATALGVISDGNFTGLIAQGQPFAASTVTGVAGSAGVRKGKVYFDISNVYRVPANGGTPIAGQQYAIKLVNGDYQLDVTNTAGSTKFATCVEYDSQTGNAFVVLDTNRQIV